MTNNDFIDESLVRIFAKSPAWYPAVAGQIMIYASRAARGISVKHNLYKIRWIVTTWIDALENQDTQG